MLAIFGGSLYLHQNGYLGRGENAVAEARAAALAHARDSDIVIVGIDAESLQALNEWPWPRRHHARLLQMLRPAAPKALFVDIDFSSRSTEEDDALFERALADWAGTPVYLASHFQARSGADDSLIVTRPLERFAAHAELASVYTRARRRRSRARHAQLLGYRRRDLPVDIRLRDAVARAQRCRSTSRSTTLVRLRLVHRCGERPRGPGRVARQDRVRRPDCDRARRHRDRPRLPRSAGRRRPGVRHGIRARELPARAARRFYAVGLAFWTVCCALLFGRRAGGPETPPSPRSASA